MTTSADLQDIGEPVTLELEPGFYSEATPRGAKGRWKDGNRVRFKNGLPQKIGGWASAAVTGSAMLGIPRRYHEWTALDGQHWIAEGTHRKLYVISNNIRYDITPVRITATLTNPFNTTNTSTIVDVDHIGHGARTGDSVRFSGATAVGGITISGEYQLTVVNGNRYQITHSTPATSTATGGGSVLAEYDISVGNASNQRARGWGTCGWGEGTWGTPRDPNCSNIISGARLWSLDNFGEDLIASPRGGAIYHWDKTSGPTTRAVLLPDAPQTNERVLMSQTGGRIICLGAFDYLANAPDPMFIIAGEEESLTAFREPAPGEEENDVYVERASKGSRLITGLTTRSGVIVFTDTAIGMLLPDPEQIYDLQFLSEGNSVIGPNAALEVNGTIYAMGYKKFFKFDGVVSEIPCPVWGYVFDNESGAADPGFNDAQSDKVYAWHNTAFNEIWWLYPSRNATENDRAVVFNHAEELWYYLALGRSAALTRGRSYDVPVMADENGVLYRHETGTDDAGAAMNEYIESHDMEIGSGKPAAYVSNFAPDMERQLGTLLLTLRAKNRPQQATYVTFGPYSFTATDALVGTRAAGRQMAVRIGSSVTGTNWRAGKFTFYVQPDGER